MKPNRAVRQTAELVLEAIDINRPNMLDVDGLKQATGRSKASIMDAISLLKAESRIDTEFDDRGVRRYRLSLYNPAEVRRAA